jgi:hypothetical protein
MFAEEQPHLQPLPLEPFRYYRYGTRSVHLDGCVEVEAAYAYFGQVDQAFRPKSISDFASRRSRESVDVDQVDGDWIRG